MSNNLTFKIPLVLHRTHGGFHLTDALVAELRSRGWEHLDKACRTSQDRWYLENVDALRRDPMLVDVVRKFEVEVQELQRDGVSWKEVAGTELALLCGLRVVEVTVNIDVEDNAGLETVHVNGGLY